MKKLYYFPSASRGGYNNPYSINYKESLKRYFNVLDANNKPVIMQCFGLLRYAISADVFVINWIESVSYLRFGILQYIITLFSLHIIEWRKKKVVWMFHNMQPHEGISSRSKKLTNQMCKVTSVVIAHSKQAAEYARTMVTCPVYYIAHPIKTFENISFINQSSSKAYDVLIWGDILPYKGVAEFLESKEFYQSNIKVKIVGCCKNTELLARISNAINKRVYFENKRVEFEKLKGLISDSKYVLFPYIGKSVSSSGCLIDTLVMGGTPIGPNVGAFKDLSEEKLCLTYNSYNELFKLLNRNVFVNSDTVRKFIADNSWEKFGDKFVELVK